MKSTLRNILFASLVCLTGAARAATPIKDAALTGNVTISGTVTNNANETATGTKDYSGATVQLPGSVTGGTTSFQPRDSDLDSIAALPTTATGRGLLTASGPTAAGLGLTNGANIDVWGAKTAPSGTVVGASDTQTLTNKSIAASQLTDFAMPSITASSLAVTVGSFRLSDFSFSGGSVSAVANKTQYLCVNMKTRSLHMLPRMYDEGVIWLARIVASASDVTTIERFTPSLPIIKIPRSLGRFQAGEAIRVNVFGSSLSEGAAWQTYNFTASSYSTGYNVGATSTDYATNGSFSTGSLVPWDGGAPTGYSIVTGVGPEGQSALQWSGAGRVWHQASGAGNVYYTATCYVKLVSGTPTATLQLKDFSTDTVRATGSVAASSSWQAITVSGTTAGVTPGFRLEFTLGGTSGTVQVTKISCIAYSSNVTKTDYAKGGATARYTAALLGTAVKTHTGYYNDTNGVSEGARPYQWVRASTPEDRTNGLSTAYHCDLAILALLANGGYDQLEVFEGVVRMLRSRNIDVLLLTDNAFSQADAYAQETDSLWVYGATVKKLADKYGCALADTAAYMREGEWRGESVYSDSIHQSTAGHAKWAEAVAGVLGHTVTTLKTDERPFEPGRYLLSPSSAVFGRVDVEFALSNTAGTPGTLVTGLASGTNVHASAYGASSTQRYDLDTGKSFVLAHPLMINADLVIDAGSSFTADVKYNNRSGTAFTIAHTSPGVNRPHVIGLSSYSTLYSAMLSALGGYGSAALEVVVTSGTCRLYGVAYHVPDYSDVTDDVKVYGSWSSEAGPYTWALLKYTDTSSDYFYLDFTGKTLAVAYRRGGGSGIATEYLSGVQQSANDLYAPGTYYGVQRFAARSYGRHQFISKYSGSNNASATAPSAGNRRLSFSQVFVIRDR